MCNVRKRSVYTLDNNIQGDLELDECEYLDLLVREIRKDEKTVTMMTNGSQATRSVKKDV
jgi:hypothetical protein